MVELSELVKHLDLTLNHAAIGDYSGARNGLQLERVGPVERVACAVDANALTIDQAVQGGADLLLVHHGIGWNDLCPVTGGRYRWLRQAIEANLAIYSSHLPLDAHDEFGNNILLARALELSDPQPYFEEKGAFIGRRSRTRIPVHDLVSRLESVLGSGVHLIGAGPDICEDIALITGGGGNLIHAVAPDGVDTFIAGEGSHWTFSAAHEYRINLILAGHYATETFGVKALGNYLEDFFGVSSIFVDCPSGL